MTFLESVATNRV